MANGGWHASFCLKVQSISRSRGPDGRHRRHGVRLRSWPGRCGEFCTPDTRQREGYCKRGCRLVKVVAPRSGGINRLCTQPGSVEPFESADLYSKVSGFLVEQNVDIGYRVHAGDVLARISVPEYETQVKEDAANVVRAEARVEQMKAAITTAEADLGAASAAISLCLAEKKSKESYRAYREKQRNRIRDLVATNSIEAKIADENEDQFQAAVSSELAAAEAINAARQKESAARARVAQARADLRYVAAEVETAKDRLEKSKDLLGYTVIRSPYTGVVTERHFHPGDFIRSADSGYAKGERVPVLAVERTDVMRVVIQVPEREVPFVDCGDPAIVEVDAARRRVQDSGRRQGGRVPTGRVRGSSDSHDADRSACQEPRGQAAARNVRSSHPDPANRRTRRVPHSIVRVVRKSGWWKGNGSHRARRQGGPRAGHNRRGQRVRGRSSLRIEGRRPCHRPLRPRLARERLQR